MDVLKAVYTMLEEDGFIKELLDLDLAGNLEISRYYFKVKKHLFTISLFDGRIIVNRLGFQTSMSGKIDTAYRIGTCVCSADIADPDLMKKIVKSFEN